MTPYIYRDWTKYPIYLKGKELDLYRGVCTKSPGRPTICRLDFALAAATLDLAITSPPFQALTSIGIATSNVRVHQNRALALSNYAGARARRFSDT
jgi:hypothetical protein